MLEELNFAKAKFNSSWYIRVTMFQRYSLLRRKLKMKIGIDLGGSHISVGAIDENGKILTQEDIQILEEDKRNIKDIIENYILTSVKK